MPRNFLKRHLPSRETLRGDPALGVVGRLLEDPNLFHLNRQSVSLAFLIGLFCAFLPLPGQMLIAALLAYWWRANLPLSVTLVWVSNPLTIAPLFYLSYRLGAWILGVDTVALALEPTQLLESLRSNAGQLWQPLILGSLCCGVFAGGMGYLLVRRVWRWQVVTRWEERKKARQNA